MSEDVAPASLKICAPHHKQTSNLVPRALFAGIGGEQKPEKSALGTRLAIVSKIFETLKNYIFVYKFSTNQFPAELTDFPQLVYVNS